MILFLRRELRDGVMFFRVRAAQRRRRAATHRRRMRCDRELAAEYYRVGGVNLHFLGDGRMREILPLAGVGLVMVAMAGIVTDSLWVRRPLGGAWHVVVYTCVAFFFVFMGVYMSA